MDWITRSIGWLLIAGVLAGASGCKNESAGSAPQPRAMTPLNPTTQPGTAATAPAASGHADAMTLLPSGHPPIGGHLPSSHPPIGDSGLPSGHPPVGGSGAALGFTDSGADDGSLAYQIPQGWVAKPPRPMTKEIYSLPRAEGDPEDGDLAVSFYPGMKNVPLEQHVARYAGQFQQPDGRPTSEVLKTTELEETAHPTTLIDVSGRYNAGSMFGPKQPPKDDFRMMTAIVNTPEGPWFFKLVGPAKTVARHEEAFLELVREAK